MRKTGTRLGSAALLLLLAFPLQGRQAERSFGFGAAGVVRQLYSDAAVTPFGFGGQAAMMYQLNRRFGLAFSAGYAPVGYERSGVIGQETTAMLSLDFAFDTYFLNSQSLQAYVSMGSGLLRFTPQNKTGTMANELFLGPGLRWFFSENLALSISGVAKYTTSDELDQIVNGGNDLYFAFRAGIDYFKPSREKSIQEELEITEIDLLEEIGLEESSQADDLFARMDSLETTPEDEAAPEQQPEHQEELFPEAATPEPSADQADEDTEEKLFDEEESLNPERPSRPQRPEAHQPRLTPQEYNERYDRGLMDFHKRKYRQAIENFRFLAQADPDNILASNCWYWMGESYFGLKEYEKAAEHFSRVLEYDKSWKTDDALLMLGRSAIKLGDYEQAREWLIRLLENFPSSEYAAKAEYYLGVGTIAE